MKYKIHHSLKNLITLFLACVLMLTMSSCDNTEEAESSEIIEETSQSDEFTLEDAKELIERDRLVTDIFINNSLCSKKIADSVAVSPQSEYSDYSKVEELLNSTYTQSGGSISAFLAYPNEALPAVTNNEGKTYVFNHIGSSYGDFIDASTVTVANTPFDTKKLIAAKTRSGLSVQLDVVYEDGNWLLEKGIYQINPPEETEFEQEFPFQGIGSFKAFSGEVLIIELFVSDKESGFTSDEEEQFHERVGHAVDYIIEQSAKYGNEVNVTYESAYFEHSGVVGTRGLDFDIVFAETGFGTLEAFAEENYITSDYDSYVFVVCQNKDSDITYSLYEDTDETQLYFGERIIIGQNASDTEICVSLLKLLGAYGYNENKCDSYTESLYGMYFPNDIMVSESLAFSEMSPVTAYACGITEELSPLYRVFYYK